jgi:methionyl-tRNA formyltransferase
MALGADVTADTIAHLVAGDLKPMPQSQLADAAGGVTQAPKIFKETCKIDWTQPAETVRNLVRGLSPYPAAWTDLEVKPGVFVNMKVFDAYHYECNRESNPGDVYIIDGKLLVRCADGWLLIGDVQPAGKKRMTSEAYLRGLK